MFNKKLQALSITGETYEYMKLDEEKLGKTIDLFKAVPNQN